MDSFIERPLPPSSLTLADLEEKTLGRRLTALALWKTQLICVSMRLFMTLGYLHARFFSSFNRHDKRYENYPLSDSRERLI